MRRCDPVLDRLTFGLGQTAEPADVQIHPAHRVVAVALADQHDLGRDQAGVTNDEAARLDHHLRQRVAEMLGHRVHDRVTELVDLRHVVTVAGRESRRPGSSCAG